MPSEGGGTCGVIMRIWTVEELRQLPVGTQFLVPARRPWDVPTGTIVEDPTGVKFMRFDKG